MKAATYPHYRTAGSRWLDKVPSHWRVEKLKFVAHAQASNVDKHSHDNEIPVRLCNYTDVYNNGRITDDLPFMEATASEKEIDKFLLRAGDVIITKDSESWDDIAVPAYVPRDIHGVLCGYHLSQIRSHSGELDGAYLYYLLKSETMNRQFQVCANGVTRFGLPGYYIDNATVVIPPLDEQRAIVRYLEAKTAQIDELIAKKERLLQLLAEKRTAIITKAATKGLNADAPTKDSGVPLIGTIPSHWVVAPLKRFLTCSSGDFLSNQEFEKAESESLTVPVVGGNGILGYTDRPNSLGAILVVGRVGAHCGNTHLIKGPSWVTDNALKVTVRSEVSLPFLKHLLDTLRPNDAANRNAQPLITGEILRRITVVMPPIDEQNAIAAFIAHQTSAISVRVAKIQETIDRLNELRSAIVTSAATGQIDVRSYELKVAAQ